MTSSVNLSKFVLPNLYELNTKLNTLFDSNYYFTEDSAIVLYANMLKSEVSNNELLEYSLVVPNPERILVFVKNTIEEVKKVDSVDEYKQTNVENNLVYYECVGLTPLVLYCDLEFDKNETECLDSQIRGEYIRVCKANLLFSTRYHADPYYPYFVMDNVHLNNNIHVVNTWSYVEYVNNEPDVYSLNELVKVLDNIFGVGNYNFAKNVVDWYENNRSYKKKLHTVTIQLNRSEITTNTLGIFNRFTELPHGVYYEHVGYVPLFIELLGENVLSTNQKLHNEQENKILALDYLAQNTYCESDSESDFYDY